LTVRYNSVPDTPSYMKIADPSSSCSTSSAAPSLINSVTPKLQARLTDADGANAELRGRVEVYEGTTLVWSYLGPEVVSRVTLYPVVPSGKLVNGHTYRWRVRAEEFIEESTDASAWAPSSSGLCYVRVDTTRPATPGVSSTDYPVYDPLNQQAY